MEDEKCMVETPRDLTKPRIAPYKNTWTHPSKYGMLVQLEGRSCERLAILPKHGHTQSVSATHYLQLALRRAVCMKTQEELWQKVRLTPRLPRVVLKANSHCGQQDLQSQDARSSWERVTGKPGTTLLTTEFLVYHFRQLNSTIQHVKTRSRS